MRRVLFVGCLSFLFFLPALSGLPAFHSGASAQTEPKAHSAHTIRNLVVAPDVAQRLARYRSVKMPLNTAGLSARERQMITHLVEASREIEDIFWRQSDPEALSLYRSLAASQDPAEKRLRRLLFINASRFDLIDDNKPIVGTGALPPGRGFYPPELTRQEIEEYVKKHPEKKDEIYSPYTVVIRRGSELAGVPYHEHYRQFLEPAARDLREAAALSEDPAFADFLRLRASALLTDDYYQSDVAWVKLENPKFDVIFAPYEVYLDGLLGVKASYGAAVLIRNEEESRKLADFQKYIPDLQEALPLPAEDLPSKRGHPMPMEVMDAPFRAGDLNHGYQAVADNLPNDPRIHQEVGSKEIFFKNFMDARVNYVILPVARLLIGADQAARATANGYLTDVMMHEISHGLGPTYARTSAGRKDIREAIGPSYSGLEEAKADVVGMFGLKWLVDHGGLPKNRLEEFYVSYVAGIFRSVRFGIAEAHGRAQMMEFNYLAEQNAIRWDAAAGRYGIDVARMTEALAALARGLLEMEATGDRARVEGWFQKYAVMPAALAAALEKAKDIPVDIDPTFAFVEPIR